MNTNLFCRFSLRLLWCCVGVVCAASLSAQNANVVAHDAWARVPAPSKMETAAYMVITRSSQRRSRR
jgi:copper(I)-binding protein